jgi:hypothetical protein
VAGFSVKSENLLRIDIASCPSRLRILVLTYGVKTLAPFDPTSNLVRQYNFPVPLRCRKTSDTVFVAFVRPLSESVRRFPHVVRTLANR